MSFLSARIPALLLLLGSMAVVPSFAQTPHDEGLELDSVRLRYRFTPGQTITYRVESYDTTR